MKVLGGLLIIACASAAVVSPTSAGALRGAGMGACQEWLAADGAMQTVYESWVLGFVSGYELMVLPNYSDSTLNIQNNQVINAVYGYCQANRKSQVADAALATITYMLKVRK